jgi:hypothetical protein
VINHRKDMKNGSEWPIIAKNMHKTYKKSGLHAVCGNTFGV